MGCSSQRGLQLWPSLGPRASCPSAQELASSRLEPGLVRRVRRKDRRQRASSCRGPLSPRGVQVSPDPGPPGRSAGPSLQSFQRTSRTRPGSRRLDANSWAGRQLARGPRDGQSCRPLWEEDPIQGVRGPRHPSLPLQSAEPRRLPLLSHTTF